MNQFDVPCLLADGVVPSVISLPQSPPYMEELVALCLLAKLWGEILLIALIIGSTLRVLVGILILRKGGSCFDLLLFLIKCMCVLTDLHL